MQERLKYKNHIGEVIDFGRHGIFVSSNDLHDYSWTVAQKNGKISSFHRDVTSRTLPVVIFCSTPEEGVAARNRLMEVAEKDVLAKKPGRIIIGDYYYKCYITGSQKSKYLASRHKMEAKLTITSDAPFWVKETSHYFRPGDGAAGQPFDYHYDYPTDYASIFQRVILTNTAFTSSNFRMVIYGPCSNPAVFIAEHAYSINCELGTGEYAVIDSMAKTITKTAQDGTVTNLFHLRGKNDYIFEKIRSGDNSINWEGDYSVDVILLEERSEPKWT